MSTTKNTIKITAAVLALVASLALTGCSSTATTATGTPAAVTTSSTPVTPTGTPSATPSPEVRVYTMANGTKVDTTKGQALPAPVVADITATVAPAAPFGLGTGHAVAVEQVGVNITALKASLAASGRQVGRQIIAIFPVFEARSRGAAPSHGWSTSMLDGHSYDTVAQAQAAVSGVVNADPTGTVVVVLQ